MMFLLHFRCSWLLDVLGVLPVTPVRESGWFASGPFLHKIFAPSPRPLCRVALVPRTVIFIAILVELLPRTMLQAFLPFPIIGA